MTATGRPTLATVAEALGVSRMTVSNAFNRPDQLSPELRERVLATAQELGYAGPNPVARTLSRGRTGSIGVVLDAPLTLAFSDPAAVQVLHGVATVCEERELGMSLVPRIPGHDAALVRTALVDGFVVYCMGDNDPRLDAIIERRLPYALIDHAPDSADLTVNIDDRGAARATVEHLIALGHRRFGIVRGWDNPAHGARRAALSRRPRAAARLARRDRGRRRRLGRASRSPAPRTSTCETGRIAGGHLLDRANRPTAIVCVSDVLALGVHAGRRRPRRAGPQALSVTGFDDVPEAARAGLTSVRQPHAEKGAAALRLLLDGTDKASVLLPTEFVPRSSTSPVSLNALHRQHPHGRPARLRPRLAAPASATP